MMEGDMQPRPVSHGGARGNGPSCDGTDVFTIRDARVSDIHAITRIYNEAIREGVSTSDLDERSMEQRRDWLAAFPIPRGGRPIPRTDHRIRFVEQVTPPRGLRLHRGAELLCRFVLAGQGSRQDARRLAVAPGARPGL